MKIPSNKVKAVAQFFRDELKEIYAAEEIENFIFFSFYEYLGYSRTDIKVKAEETMSESDLLKFNFCVKDLKNYKPIQYIIGSTKFCGCKIKVNEHVLIPRPETEELVELIKSQIKKNQTILDIGTGSGCIAIALKKYFPEAEVFAMDVSEKALEVAGENSNHNNIKINFIHHDIFSDLPNSQSINFNVIVSNPPYVRMSEKENISKNVLDFEPHLALFVNDDDALKFYKAICVFAQKHLLPNGKLFFEINEALAGNVEELLFEKGFKNVQLRKDMQGKSRMLSGEI